MKKNVLALILLLITLPLFGAISVDTTATGYNTGVNAFTFTVTVGSGTNKMLAIGIVNNNDVTVSNLKVNDNSATQAGHVVSTFSVSTDLWYYANASAGANTIRFDTSSFTTSSYGVISYFGVSGIGDIDTASALGTYIGITTTTTQANSVISSILGELSGTASITNVNVTTQWTQNPSNQSRGADRTTTTTGNYLSGFNLNSSNFIGMVAMELKASADASTDTPTNTITYTPTPTCTFTSTPTVTFTSTSTSTITNTPTVTFTKTITSTGTPTPALTLNVSANVPSANWHDTVTFYTSIKYINKGENVTITTNIGLDDVSMTLIYADPTPVATGNIGSMIYNNFYSSLTGTTIITHVFELTNGYGYTPPNPPNVNEGIYLLKDDNNTSYSGQSPIAFIGINTFTPTLTPTVTESPTPTQTVTSTPYFEGSVSAYPAMAVLGDTVNIKFTTTTYGVIEAGWTFFGDFDQNTGGMIFNTLPTGTTPTADNAIIGSYVSWVIPAHGSGYYEYIYSAVIGDDTQGDLFIDGAVSYFDDGSNQWYLSNYAIVSIVTVTETITETVTYTVTETITETVTETITETVTYTVTETITPTITETITHTITPTITATITQTITLAQSDIFYKIKQKKTKWLWF